MTQPKASKDDHYPAIRRITLVGLAINVFLIIVKFFIGLLTGSMALIADGLHSLSDMLTDIIVIVGAYFSDMPPDESHPYGHGKIETFSALGVSLFLIATGGAIAVDSGLALYSHQSFIPGFPVIGAALVSIVLKEILYHATRRVARQTHSPSVLANAWHHRSDALSSVAVLLGGVAGLFGFDHGDQVAGIVVGIMVTGAGGSIASGAIGDLMERSIGEADLKTIRACLEAHPKARSWHRLRTRKVGREIFLDAHVLVDPALTVAEGHAVAHEIQEAICAQITLPMNFTIHIEPERRPPQNK
jgi:cation diffusion facilitator family transporter